ncbi:enoyl-CoA hydratase/isomerase family protein [Nocardioides sp.]|uniref:enoyl-CoA hydratase/isomerase family protein n=1 Tax=Nocardioides sp. TaxID=35761 RepID=UPI002734E698|nr:enoyl-CoA hydratase-related protein [Nocardioides sp.]MDP3891067.1 enoyl-CoA hydratase-related protein [Nocardioides sp.]
MPVLLSVRRGVVAEVTLNRPTRGNALSTELKEALVAELEALAADDGVRAVLLTGAGATFCVGQDLGELAAALEEDPATASETVGLHFNPITRALATMPKPVVAAVNGTCVGAGLGFALACDLQVWAAGATLATAFSGVGLTCDSGLSASLARSVGESRARSLVLLGDPFTPDQGVSWGLAGAVVAASEVLGHARDLADRLAAGPTRALAESKRLIAAAPSSSLDEVLAAEAAGQAACGRTRDHAAAVAGFLARTPVVFEGR